MREKERGSNVVGGDMKRKGKLDPLSQTKQPVRFRDKGNAICHVTMNAGTLLTRSTYLGLHSTFPPFRFIHIYKHREKQW